MNKAYKFRLYPNKEQEILINKTIGASRFMFNQLLAERISNYEQCKTIEDKEERKLALKELKQSTPAQYKEVVSEFQVVGLDFSMKDLYYSSEDKKANYPRYYKESLEKLAIEQRKLSRKKIGSKNREKQRLKIAKLHEHVANQRKDFLHKKSRELVNEFDAVCIEDLNMKAMSKCLNFGKSVHDNGWGMFTVFLDYKLQQEGKQLIKIDKWYPSSKTCSCCGNVKSELGLGERVYICENCGIELDRDYNASLNIKRVGMTQLAW